MSEIGVIASGAKVIRIRLRRDTHGMRVSVKVHPEIETFFQQWGGGAMIPAEQGRLWKAREGALFYWSLPGTIDDEGQGQFTLHETGQSLLIDGENGTRANLSMLRLVGAGSDWISFDYDEAISTTGLDKAAIKIRRAAEQFYAEYIRPTSIEVFVGVRELRGEQP